MRPWWVLLAGCLVYICAVVMAAGALPADDIPLHFDATGTADRFGSRGEALGVFIGLGVLLSAVGAGGILFARRGSLSLVNVPYREYWTAPERRDQLRRMIAWDIALLMSVTLVFAGLLPLALLTALDADPVGLPAPVLWGVLGGYLVAVAVWIFWLVTRRYRPRSDS